MGCVRLSLVTAVLMLPIGALGEDFRAARTKDHIRPILDCTARNAAREYVGYFGYLNEELHNLTVPIGTDNYFTPPPEGRGPTTFLPGRHHFVFSVPHDGGAVTWHLTHARDNSSQEWHERCKPACMILEPITVDSCNDYAGINGSLSSTLNNNGAFSAIEWNTSCSNAALIRADTLTPAISFPGLTPENLPKPCMVTLRLTDDTRFGSGNPHELQTVSCSAKVEFKTCSVDCAGTPGGSAKLDECGVCNGDNSTCADCNGVPNGGGVVDRCGVCGGHNETCADCAGVPNGPHTEDACGVCGGDGSTCEDCAGVPNGGAVIDACGDCAGDGSSCADCAGTPNGHVQVDLCGVCGGDNSSCEDCFGIPNGGAVRDGCGVCGGDGSRCSGGCPPGAKPDQCGVCGGNDSTCSDCRGVVHGRTAIDACGVCGGDNSSCIDCAGVLRGHARRDACGVCGGDGSTCADCAGVPNGDARVDLCGVCGGNNTSCLDCASIAGGETAVDSCGVCGGDGTMCGLCEQIGMGQAGQEVLEKFGYFTHAIKEFAEGLARCDAGQARQANRVRLQGRALRFGAMLMVRQEYAAREFVCSSNLCEMAQSSEVKSFLKRLAHKLFVLLYRVQAAQRACINAPPWDGPIVPSVWTRYEDLLSSIELLPGETVQCRNSLTVTRLGQGMGDLQ